MNVPERELLRTNHDKTAPLRTPTHIGCAFSVDREFFFEIGSFDEGMDIWGSENVELAFRVRFQNFTSVSKMNKLLQSFLDMVMWWIT